MRSPLVAMVWEQWRLTRTEAVQRLAVAIVGGAAALTWLDNGARVAVWVLLSQFAMFWMSIAKLNGGRFMDGYKPGFPLPLLYARPVSTGAIVGVAMAYDAVSCAAMYLGCAALLQFAFGQPLPMLPMAGLIVAFHALCTAIQWATRSRVVQWVGSFGLWIPVAPLLLGQPGFPLHVEFSFGIVALMALIAVVSFGLTVAGVARQRRGDSTRAKPRSAGLHEPIASLLPLPCPTSSATRAQVWFELKSSGLPVLVLGAVLAIVTAVLFALSIPFTWFRPFAIGIAMFSSLVVLILGGGNAFGIRRKNGRAYASPFEATLPYGTAGLAALKLLVRSMFVWIALVAVGASIWASSALINPWGPWMMDGKPAARNLLRLRRDIATGLGAFTAPQLTAMILVTLIGIVVMVALRAAFTALRARHARRVNVVCSLMVTYGLALILLKRWMGSAFPLDTILRTTGWTAAGATVLAVAYLFWQLIAERVLTTRAAWGAALASAAFAAVWLALQFAAGITQERMLTSEAIGLMLPAWMLPAAGVLAVWSFSRMRHT